MSKGLTLNDVIFIIICTALILINLNVATVSILNAIDRVNSCQGQLLEDYIKENGL